MIDQHGRNITYLRISVTDKCNLRCRYCMPEDGVCKKEHADMLTEDEIIAAVEAAASLGIRKIRITGGEPLVKKNIVSICRRAAAVRQRIYFLWRCVRGFHRLQYDKPRF